ncbi:rab guanine nucleotide exchange factor S2 [Lunasporangiospora selenospora]|uniref:Rab guanine nucleotide exchange factor S2 n=1 Tax=Lunasporangiospora selenospora TaxID=979761 RepID=A0A9P6KHG4_9FUNG|nr:rab guanine nucleotide exchange factor S2 [Lunasporangiospora selenospora]
MSATCSNCGAAVQLPTSTSHQLQLPNDPLIPFVKAQIDSLTAQNSTLVAENDSLSSKLVESTEGRMELDQQLTVTQMELQASQSELQTLKENQKHYEQLLGMISSGQLIEKKDVQPVIENLAYESQRRSQIENSKLKLELELEDLSRSLFEEANRMVNEERQVNYLANKRIEGLEKQLDEVLDLCKSERDQLVELKVRMEKLSEEKDSIQRERDTLEFAFSQLQQQQIQQHSQLLSSASPAMMQHHISVSAAARRGIPGASLGSLSGPLEAGTRKQQVQYRSSASSIKSKTDSCYFSDGDHPGSHLLNDNNEDRIPTLGFHLWDPCFIEFKAYIEGVLGTPTKSGGTGQEASPKQSQPPTVSPVATSAISSMYSFGIIGKSNPATTPTANSVVPINTLLSNCRLLKKMAAEDVDATLKFEPGNLLSWTQRKRLMNAVTENTLVVEAGPSTAVRDSQTSSPVSSNHLPDQKIAATPGISNGPSTPAKPSCALCGHGITTPLYYQYRLTDMATESKVICPYCRTRLTSVCTFYSVLRMISKRIISSSTTPEKLYLDFLRIRMGMFLARCGVGVITGDEAKPTKRESARTYLHTLTTPRSLDPSSGPAMNQRNQAIPVEESLSSAGTTISTAQRTLALSSSSKPVLALTPTREISSPIKDSSQDITSMSSTTHTSAIEKATTDIISSDTHAKPLSL